MIWNYEYSLDDSSTFWLWIFFGWCIDILIMNILWMIYWHFDYEYSLDDVLTSWTFSGRCIDVMNILWKMYWDNDLVFWIFFEWCIDVTNIFLDDNLLLWSFSGRCIDIIITSRFEWRICTIITSLFWMMYWHNDYFTFCFLNDVLTQLLLHFLNDILTQLLLHFLNDASEQWLFHFLDDILDINYFHWKDDLTLWIFSSKWFDIMNNDLISRIFSEW
jgi:hypothetical protein